MNRPHVPQRLVTLVAAAAMTLTLSALSTNAGASPLPSVTSIAATPTTVPSAGHVITLAITAADGGACRVSVSPALVGLPVKPPCGSGSVSDSVVVPKNTGAQRTFTFTLKVGSGSSATTATTTVTQGSGLSPLTWGPASTIDPRQGGLVQLSCPTTTFCGAIDLSGDVVTMTGTTWSEPTALGVGETGETQPQISCAAPSTCVVLDAIGDAFVYDGTTWSGPTLVDAHAVTSSLSCGSPTFCMLIDGTAVGATRQYLFNGSTWSGPTGLSGFHNAPALSCPSTTFCMLANQEGNVRTYNGVKWSATKLVSRAGLYALSCASSTFCVASDFQGDALTYKGSGWSAPKPVDASLISQLSCPSAGYCAAADDGGRVSILNGATWSKPTQVGRKSVVLSSLSCAAPGSCVTADPLTGGVFQLTGTTWGSPIDVDPYNILTASSCSSATFCMVVDSRGGVLSYNGTTWSAVNVVDPGHQALAVACTTDTTCVMTDDAGQVLTESSGTWSAPTVIDAGHQLVSLSCPTTSFCAATDERGWVSFYNGASWTVPVSSGLPVTVSEATLSSSTNAPVSQQLRGMLAEHRARVEEPASASPSYSPASPSTAQRASGVSSILVVSSKNDNLDTSLSCTSATACTLVGGTDAVTYNGATWSKPVVVLAAATGGFGALSCFSARGCMATTFFGQVLHEGASKWSELTDLGPRGIFPMITCSSATFCGYSLNGRFASFNGSTWSKSITLFASLSPFDFEISTTLACSGSSLCVAADYSGDAKVGTS